MTHFNKIFLLSIFLLLPIANTQAATLYFDPPQGEYGIGDQFTVDARLNLDKAEECINTVETGVNFDSSFLELVDFGVGESFLTLWLNRPTNTDMSGVNQQKLLKFTGGVPGGYCGKIPGDQGDSNILGKLVFKVVKATDQTTGPQKISFTADSKILKNDGFGTEAKVTTQPAQFTLTEKRADQKADWDQLKATDYLPPEQFQIQLLQNPNLFEGKYYLMFNTVDKQTGLDHYEVSEQTTVNSTLRRLVDGLMSVVPGYEGQQANWQIATAPYVLRDQHLNSIIRVKAVDKAGNQLVVERGPQSTFSLKEIIVLSVVFVLLLLLAAIGLIALQKKFKSKERL